MINKINELKLILDKNKIGIACITETWLNKNNTIYKDFCFNNQFQPLFANREKRKGGGCAILLSNDLTFRCIFQGSKFQCELICIKLLTVQPILIICIYRPPDCTAKNTKKILKYIYNLLSNTKRYIILGDFNSPNVDWNKLTASDMIGKVLLEFINQTNTIQKVNKPTREKAILDLVLSFPDNLVSTNVIENFSTSDHNMVKFKVCINERCKRIKQSKVLVRNINKKNLNECSKNLSSIKWDYILPYYFSIEEKYSKLTICLLRVFDKVMPLRPINKIIKEKYSRDIKDLYNRKLLTYNELKKTPSNMDIKLKYKIISKQLKTKIQSHHLKKEQNAISKGYNSIHKFIKNKIGENGYITFLTDSNDKIYKDNLEKSNILAKTFLTNFSHKDLQDEVITENNEHSIHDLDLDVIQIRDLLRKLPNKNSTSPDGIPYILLKHSADELAPVLTEIFRIILDSGNIPRIWRTSIIIPIHKKGDKSDPNNYRPISLTCTLCRVLERLISIEIIKFLNKKSYFSDDQYAFLTNRSTSTQLLVMLNDFYNAIQENKSIDIVYIDFARAFDSVPINRILYKLKSIGIAGKIYTFIKNFLENRTFRVKIENTLSDSYPTLSGVPQGSVLGPLLFLIFINDLTKYLPEGIHIKIYADDVKLYIDHNNDLRTEVLSEALSCIEHWSSLNGLDISLEKCVVLYIGKNNHKRTYKLLGKQMSEVDSVRDLGIIIDSSLSFSKHYEKIIKNAYFLTHQIFRVIKTKDINKLVFCYKTYVRPCLEYATEVWNPSKAETSHQIERVQKFFTRIALKICSITPRNYEERLKLCKLKKLTERRCISDLCMTYKFITGHTHLKPDKFFIFAKRNLRRKYLIQNKGYSFKTKNNFFIRVINIWNKLPKEVIECANPKKFRVLANCVDFGL
uniref:Reverse transcriptase domain-containing protein n=1 Tax=Meloidogyne enterolobii TaxID=390850 RepID=A0A6V7XAY2_MELEN|nr:unnamed protein product [Meloidogyne enterolobii]